MAVRKVSLAETLAAIREPWRPKVVASLNGHEVKLARLQGEFCWHAHDETDELFLCVEGRVRIETRGESVELGPGELGIVPRGVEHRPVSREGAAVLVFERAGTRNTGGVEHPTLTAPQDS